MLSSGRGKEKLKFSKSHPRLKEAEAEGKKTATSNSAEDEAGLLLEALHHLEEKTLDIDNVLSSPVFS